MFQTIKLFDLAEAPTEFRGDDQFQPLQSRADDLELPTICLRVGEYAWSAKEAEETGPVCSVTYAEFLLHQWLLEQGAERGEMVVLAWRESQTACVNDNELWNVA